jgi:hypothetical protein
MNRQSKWNWIDRDDRSCFGIAWFRQEAEADRYAAHVTERGWTYNGGFYHGRPCGRDQSKDQKFPNGDIWYAVTD